MKLVIVHYHLLPGGVTGVIREALGALLRLPDAVGEVVVVSGSGESTEEALAAVRWEAPDCPCTVEVVPEIGYMSAARLAEYAPSESGAAGGSTFRPEGRVSDADVRAGTTAVAERIVTVFRSRFIGDDTVWWIHNHHLGKNPAFTAAVAHLVKRLPDQRIMLEIHDFPECGRYANVRFLERAGDPPLYPSGRRVTYVTINSRDRALLEQAGLAPVAYLPDPVSVSQRPTGVPDAGDGDLATRLHRAFGTEYPSFDPSRSVVIYPVRTIRRKNILEAALIAALVESGPNLVVTLPGVSQPEQAYSNMVESAYREGLIRGMWGIGSRLDDAGIPFDQLQAGADAVISTSVQEGFGYMYATAPTLGKPLVARYLDILPDIEPLFTNYPHLFYDEVRVPATTPSLSNPLPFLRFRYDERIDRLAKSVGTDAIDRIRVQLDHAVNERSIEFSFLPPQMQYAYLKDIRDHASFCDDVRAMNAPMLDQVETVLNEPATPRATAVEALLGGEAFARTFLRIVDAKPADAASSERSGLDSQAIKSAMLDAFADARYQRLLYE